MRLFEVVVENQDARSSGRYYSRGGSFCRPINLAGYGVLSRTHSFLHHSGLL